MREYWLTQYLLATVGWGYIMLALIVLGLALWIPERKAVKLVAGAIVLGVGSILPIRGYQGYLDEKKAAQQFGERYAKARALFEERCKMAGERILKTVAGVEGIFLDKVRPERTAKDRSDPNWADAALPDEHGGDWYLISFIGWEQRQGSTRGPVNIVSTPYPGYKYVDVGAEDNKGVVRYTLTAQQSGLWKLTGSMANNASRYAISFVNPVRSDDRANWIAETVISVTDRETSELLAERRSFSFDPGLGSTQGGRAPWGLATTCPPSEGPAQTRFFVEKVLDRKGAQ